jgi:branched-subunit amino acid aminotransferase/4-amino-4-deoxychorismate lyase
MGISLDLVFTENRIIARRRAEVANPQWVQDVLRRKMTIAEGEGVVHGKKYVLAKDFDITLRPWDKSLAGATTQKDPATA